MHKRTLGVLTTAALAITGATVAAAQSAEARTIESALAISSFGQLAVDGHHQRLFLSDPAAGDVLVTDYSGTTVTALAGLAGAKGLLVSGDVLYVAVAGGAEIVAFDTATLTQAAAYPVGDGNRPETLARSGDTLWFGYTTGDPNEGRQKAGIGSLDLAGADHAVALFQNFNGADPLAAAVIAVSPTDPNLIAAVDPGTSPGTVGLYGTSSGTPTLLTERSTDDGSSVIALSFSPDGTEVIEDDYHSAVALSATDLSTVTTYPADDSVLAVAVRSNGDVATGSSDVSYFQQGSATAIKTFGLYHSGDQVDAYGLAWEPGGQRIFAVAETWTGEHQWSLQVLNDPAKEPTTLGVTAPASVKFGANPQITGTVRSSAAPLAGVPVVITRKDAQSPNGTTVVKVVTASDGSFQTYDSPPVGGTVTYTATYAGDDKYAAASGTATVEVIERKATTLTLDHNKTIYNYGTTVTFTAHLGSTYSNRTVAIWADPAGSDQANRLLRSATADAKGNVTASVKLSRTTVVSAVYAGDDRTLPITAKSTVYPHASVSLSLSRQYKTAGGYAYFHKSASPYFTTTINPYPKRKQYLEIQVWSGGKWRAFRSGYFTLLSSGKGYAQLTGAGKVGAKFRVRAGYVYSKSGDTANVSTYTGYKYFMYTK